MAPAGCHTHRHASHDSYYKNMINLIHHIYHSSHPFGHITSHSIPCKNKTLFIESDPTKVGETDTR
ncbi:hypothetical protein T12_4457 [Trichinella patagoniensis]|uniref:Uncharacterized protein n=1 Tax=Trichinella patagoniensis TaxID=990121 RepID=A0A0V0YUW3_9BILA|nr:hypothetical protein T12_4457 [Trichinella patagoniensis]